jgi:predicted nucleic acid-binding protein
MVIVDSCVWIDVMRGNITDETIVLGQLMDEADIGVGDLILYEILRGVPAVRRYDRILATIDKLTVCQMGGRQLVMEAVHNSKYLNTKGIQVATVDCLIATYCIVNGDHLLSSDHHFQPFVDYCGLKMM